MWQSLIKRNFIIHNLLWIEKINSKSWQMIYICKICVNWSSQALVVVAPKLATFFDLLSQKLWIRIYCPTFSVSLWILISTISHVWFVFILNFGYFIRKNIHDKIQLIKFKVEQRIFILNFNLAFESHEMWTQFHQDIW